jgi:thiamine-phosphate pyrophosphorylase
MPISFRLYLITDGYDETTADRVAAALAAAPLRTCAVQLRCKSVDGARLLAAAERLQPICAASRAPFFVNDRVDVALAAGADGAHLPARGLPLPAARRLVGDRLLLSASAHSLSEAKMAARGGADFVTFGPVFATPSKAAYGPPLGETALAEVVHSLPVPVFAVGGIGPAEAGRVQALGAGVACIRAILGADNPGTAMGAMTAALADGTAKRGAAVGARP